MSSGPFNFFPGGQPKPGERLEMNANGDMLKKYGGTPTSWPTQSVVQLNGQSHKSQQATINGIQNNINGFFRENF